MSINNEDPTILNSIADYLHEFYVIQQENINKKQKRIRPLDKTPGRLIFRGLPDKSWNIISSAGRRLLVEEGKDKQNDFIRYHVNLIANARKYGYGGIEAETKLNDLELLAEIQHYGGATCLTDFTTNFLIAVWFSTNKQYEIDLTTKIKKLDVRGNSIPTDGKVVWLDLENEDDFCKISYYNQFKEGDTIQKLLTKVTSSFESKQRTIEPRFWFWKPSKLNNRIVKQDSVFLFGLQALRYSDDNENKFGKRYKLNFKELIILEKDKENLRKELECIFGITAETVYYDLSGYSFNANGVKENVNECILPKNECLNNAKENIRKEQYSLAIGYLDEALTCKKECNSNCKKDKTKKACSNDNKGELLFWRGLANERKNYLDEALLNYYEAAKYLEITKIEKMYRLLCESYRKRSNIHYLKKNYTDAIKVEKELLRLYNNPRTLDFDVEKDKTDRNGVDAIFALLELAILTLDKELFDNYINDARCITSGANHNGAVLFIALEGIGNAFFNGNRKTKEGKRVNYIDEEVDIQLDSVIKKIDEKTQDIINDENNVDEENNMILGYYYWNYIDIIEMIENNQNKTNYPKETDSKKQTYQTFISDNSEKLTLIAKKAHEAQNKLLNKVFSESASVRDKSQCLIN